MPNGDEQHHARLAVIDTRLSHIEDSVNTILLSQREHAEWMREVDSRLSAGNVTFDVHGKSIDKLSGRIEQLQKSDRGVLVIATALGGGIGTLIAWLTK